METTPVPFKSDLTSFNESIESISEGTHDFLWHRHRTQYLGTIIVAVLVSTPFLYLSILAFLHGQDPRGPLLLAVLPFILPGSYYATVSAKMEQLFYQQLSAALGFTYAHSAPYSTAKGCIFEVGHSASVHDILAGTYRGMPMRLFRYSYAVGSGKYQQWFNHAVCELTVPYALPELLVISKDFGETRIGRPPETVPLQLEGPFNTEFEVYIAEGKQIEALQILEPDVMAELMDTFEGYGFECAPDRVNVFTNARTYSKTDYQQMVKLVDNVFDELIPELARL